MNFAKENGGLEYASKLMNDFKNRAITELADFPDGDAKNALIQCAEFAAARKK
jgi:octaprenyl-diphosphate synthase